MPDYNCETCEHYTKKDFNPEVEAYCMMEIYEECDDVAAVEIGDGKTPTIEQLFEMSSIFNKEGFQAKFEFFNEEKKILVHIEKN